jgi:hypothetical protein
VAEVTRRHARIEDALLRLLERWEALEARKPAPPARR